MIISSINEYATSNWSYHVCMSDYIFQKWHKPRYPNDFWRSFHLLARDSNINFEISQELQEIIDHNIYWSEIKSQAITGRWFRLAKNKKVNSNAIGRIRLAYFNFYQVRWTHTEAIQKASSLWHPMTSLFARKAVDYVNALNNHWSHFHVIEQAKKAFPYRQIVYQHYSLPVNNISKISKVVEHNLTTNFYPLTLLGIKVPLFQTNVIRNTSHQARDDIIINTQRSDALDSRVHGLDQKAVSVTQIEDPELQNPDTCYSKKSHSFILMSFFLPNMEENAVFFTLLFGGFVFMMVTVWSKKFLVNIYFLLFSIGIISIFSLLSFTYPKFSFAFMVFVTCFLTVLTIPYDIFPGFTEKQKYFLNKILIFLDKTLILDYVSVIFVKFFSAPPEIYLRRLILIFCINFIYIICSRGVFIHVVFWNQPLENIVAFLIYIILFLGISIIYLRLLINLSMFLVYSALRINPLLLSPSILYVLGHEDSDIPNMPKKGPPSPTDRKFSLINVTVNREYYRQYFNQANPKGFRYMGYGLAICGTVFAGGTFWYSRTQSYHTAREADVAAVDAGLITKNEYYRRHPEDLPPKQ